MHEMSLMKAVVRAVLAECEGKGVTKVTAVNMSIGEMRDVVEKYVPDLFSFLSRGTIAQDAELRIARIPTRVRCRGCGEIFPLDRTDPAGQPCPRCGGHGNHVLFSGMEFQIDSIEVVCDTELSAAEPTLITAGSAA